MPSHTIPKTQHVEHFYRVVIVGRRGDRTTVAEHNEFRAADQIVKAFPTEEGSVIRIESAVKPTI